MSRYFRVGLFLVVTLLILCGGVFLIGSKDLRFGSKYHIKAQFQNVAGLQPGADVRVGGIHVGRVTAIILPTNPKGQVTVQLELEQKTHSIVNSGSAASISSEGLLGDKYIEVSFGSPDGARVQDWDTIKSVPPIDISDLVKQANQILDNTNDALKNVESTTSNLDEISNKINQGQGTVGALINNPTLYNRVNSGVTAFQEDMEALKHNFLVRGFFKDRGYEDSTELTKHQIDRLPATGEMKKFVFDGAKLFDKAGSAKLRSEKQLNEAGAYLESNSYRLAVVVASEGATGDSDKDLKLSQARAMVVRDYLVSKFRVKDTLLKTLPLGKSSALGDKPQIEIVAYPGGSTAAESVPKR